MMLRAAKLRFKQLAAAFRGKRSAASKVSREGRSRESGFAFLLALALVLVTVALTSTFLQIGATQHRRAVEEETIWRGNQYVRAIRLYYHKTGRYPQTLDDLNKGLPELHFLRQPYKNPTDSSEGAWRLIYVNQTGQIIGSTKYATLQQMAVLDLNGGVIPGAQQIPGQIGTPVSSLSSFGSSSDTNGQGGQNGQNGEGAPGAGNISGNGNGNGNANAPATPATDASGNPLPPDQPANLQDGQTPSGTGQNPNAPANGQPAPPGSLQNPGGILGLAGGNLSGVPGQGQTAATGVGALAGVNLAALATLKPTGPVDGPVLGAFLTGVACTGDRTSQKVYHGGKKYIDWEFIWNPLEDAAAAAQQQGSSGQGGILGGVPAGAAGNGNSTGGGTAGSSFGTSNGNSNGSSNGNSGFGNFGGSQGQQPTPPPSQPPQ
jgi:hypothetical protein